MHALRVYINRIPDFNNFSGLGKGNPGIKTIAPYFGPSVRFNLK